jgi:hypothetical protein
LALFVVIAGALLIIGGGTSLVLGFDIVMTERGSAMTLGGVMALSSGVIAVGIGFALMRMTQMLRMLDIRAKGFQGPGGRGSRPVVPLVPAEQEVSDAAPVESSASRRRPSIAAGGAGAVLAGGAAHAAAAAAHEALSPAPAAASMMSSDASSPSQVSVPPDLEAELARALLDTGPSSAPARSFADGLYETLAEPAEARLMPPPDESVAAAYAGADLPAVEKQELSPDDGDAGALSADEEEGIADGADEETSEAPAAEEAPAHDPAIAAAAPDTARSILETPGSGSIAMTTPGARDAFLDEPDFDDLKVGPRLPPQHGEVLGTYNIGGRTYSMYSDGSVEAITEGGIERFSSMDDLRQHLAKN